jgi:amicyanin
MKRTWLIFATIIFVGTLTFSILVSVHGQTPTNMQHMNHETAAKEAAGTQVVIDNFSFTPATLTVAAGTQVTWTNHDDIPHTVVSTDKDNKKIKSKALDTNDTFSFTFTDPGTYEYFCSLHPKMTAKVIVEKK